MCQESKFDVIDPRIHLNKSRLHLNRNGYAIMGKNFVNLILKHHVWLDTKILVENKIKQNKNGLYSKNGDSCKNVDFQSRSHENEEKHFHKQNREP